MDSLELIVQFKAEDSIKKEIFTAELADLGFESFVEEESILKAYIQENNYQEPEVNSFLAKHVDVKYSVTTIKQQNWNAEWENNYHPIIYQDKCIVKASFHQIEKKYPIEIIIDPKMSFGTGHHETTSLMIEKMFDMDFQGKTVLDMGTGTGILAILAAKLGAKKIIAIDNDEWSYENSVENCEKNNIQNVKVILGEATKIPKISYDIILANINRNILLSDLKYYVEHLAERGGVILSGIYEKDKEKLDLEANQHNLRFVDFQEKNNWIAIRYKKA